MGVIILLKELIQASLFYKLYKCVRLRLLFPDAQISFESKVNLNDSITGKISLGRNVQIGRDVLIQGKIKIGDWTYFSDGSTEINSEQSEIEFGKYCSVARNVFLRTTSHFINGTLNSPRYFANLGYPYPNNSRVLGPIKIGNDVWVGANVTILGGVVIGDGVIIGAGSVVTKSLPPYSIAVGVPARVKRFRFSEDIIRNLQETKPWNSVHLYSENTHIFHE